jgi:hypothetical protein
LDDYYSAKHDDEGNVRADWSFDRWIEERVAGWRKSPSPDAQRLGLDLGLLALSSRASELHAEGPTEALSSI